MGRPSKGERVRMTVALPAQDAAEVLAMAARRGIDRGEVVAEMVADALARPQVGDAAPVITPAPRAKRAPEPKPRESAAPSSGWNVAAPPGSRLKKR